MEVSAEVCLRWPHAASGNRSSSPSLQRPEGSLVPGLELGTELEEANRWAGMSDFVSVLEVLAEH